MSLDLAEESEFAAIAGTPPMSNGKEMPKEPAPAPEMRTLKRDDAKLMMDAMQAVMQAVDAYGNDSFNPGRHGRIVYLLFEDAKRLGYVDQSMLDQLLAIAYSQS
jgi:hypothetical protein